jgi:hypothetical protein
MNKPPYQPEHPPESVLLRFVDGELDAKRAAVIREHLEACWRCRAATEEMQETIRDYVRFHSDRIVPAIPGPPRHWHGFEAALNETESQCAAARGWKNRFFAFRGLIPRAVWIGSAVVTCAVALGVFLELTSSPANTLSAAEVLRRAIASDSTARADQPRRVRIRFRGQALVRNVGANAPVAHDVIEPLFRSSRLDWKSPLSAQAFMGWHDGLHTKSDHVRVSPDRIAVDTRTDEGRLRHASFTVRAEDYHPIEESSTSARRE